MKNVGAKTQLTLFFLSLPNHSYIFASEMDCGMEKAWKIVTPSRIHSEMQNLYPRLSKWMKKTATQVP